MSVGDLAIGIKLTLDNRELAGNLEISRAQLRKFADDTRRAAGASAEAFSTTRTALKSISTQLAEARNAVLGYFSAVQAAAAARAILDAADATRALSARLRIATSDATEFARAQAGVFEIANRYGAAVDETARAFARLNPVIQQMGGGSAETLRMLDGLAASLKLSGATAAETSGVLLQFSQAMGSGKVSGDELRALMENAEPLMRAVAQQMGKTTGELRAMAEQGQLTSAAFGNALLPAIDRLRQQAGDIPLGLSGSMQILRNEFTRAFGREFESRSTALSDAVRSIADSADFAARAVRVLTDAVVELGKAAAMVFAGAAIGGFVAAIGRAGAAVVALREAIAAVNVVTAALVFGAVMKKLESLSKLGRGGLLGLVFFGAYELTDWLIQMTGLREKIADALEPAFRLFDRVKGIDREAEARAAAQAAAATAAAAQAAPRRLSDPSAFARLTQDLAYETRLRAKHKQELLDLETAYQDKLATLKDEKARQAFTQEFREARRELLLRQQQEMQGILSRKLGTVTQPPKLAEVFDAELASLRANLKTAEDVIEQSFRARLLTEDGYWQAKAETRRQALDLEARELRARLAEQQDLLARLSAAKPKDANEQADIADRVRQARNKIAELQVQLDALAGRRITVDMEIRTDRARLDRELADIRARLEQELAQASGTETPEMRIAAIRREYDDLLARFGNDPRLVELLDRLVPVKAARADLADLERQWNLVMERMRTEAELTRVQQEAGLLTQTQAQRRIVGLQRQAADEAQRLIPAMQQAAASLGPEAEQRVRALTVELVRLRVTADEFAPLWQGIGGAFAAALEGMVTRTKSWRDALYGLFVDVAAAFRREIVLKPLQEWIAAQARMLAVKLGFVQQEAAAQTAASQAIVAAKQQEAAATVSAEAAKAGAGAAASQASIPIVGPGLAIAAMAAMVAAVMALLARVRRFAVGGAVPGAGDRDSVPALLTPGEFVLRRDVARRIGYDLLAAINGGIVPPRVIAGRLAFADGGMVPAAAATQPVRIVNAIDPAIAADWIGSAAGERVVLNLIARNAPAVRTILAGA